ncbi:MAG: hypothetical protein ABII18_06110 [bacterium]|nr:hypothetical protein [bacterium]MBU1917196.1 hypothetical protein [bacterium]
MSKKFRNIFILGGHELSFSYFEKIKKAKNDDKIDYEHIYLITPETNSYAHQELTSQNLNLQQFIINTSYHDFILTHGPANGAGARHRKQDKRTTPQTGQAHDAVVPDHTAKHTMLQTYLQIAEKHNPQLSPIDLIINLPFIKKLEKEAIWALSYATWTCPLYCDEPEICPYTTKQRDWDLGKIRIDGSMGRGVVGIFSCEPLVDEIVYISMLSIYEQIEAFQEQLNTNQLKEVYVFTHSHCHGILGKFIVD